MNALSFLGYAIALTVAAVAPFIVARWARASWHAAKALRVLLRERRTGETLYDCAEAIAGDAHNWRGMTVERDEHNQKELVDAPEITAPQPPPQNSDGPALWPLIISELGDSETDRLVAIDMQQRHEFGVAKYGVPLVASNGRDHLADAYQEALDGVAYLRAAASLWGLGLAQSVKDGTETDEQESRCGHIWQLYIDMLDMAKEIRELIRRRDGR